MKNYVPVSHILNHMFLFVSPSFAAQFSLLPKSLSAYATSPRLCVSQQISQVHAAFSVSLVQHPGSCRSTNLTRTFHKCMLGTVVYWIFVRKTHRQRAPWRCHE